MAVHLCFLTFSFLISYIGVLGLPCSPRSFGYGSFVCVCNNSYCDTLDPVLKQPFGQAIQYESNKASKRFASSKVLFRPTIESEGQIPIFTVKQVEYQKIFGFGGAFTDAVGINIESLPLQMQKDLLKSYFSRNGLEYNFGRVPIASCDFSTYSYSYDDYDGDFNLTHFKLADEDFKYKIPYIKMAQEMSERPLKLFASSWSAPGWMKSSGQMKGPGTLKGVPGGKYYQTWADYTVKFFQEYLKNNISFWGLTGHNEPLAGFIPGYQWQAMGFTPETQRDFIKLHLGPALEKSGFGNIKIMILDDQRAMLPGWADRVLSDPDAAQYVSGIAFHWYWNFIAPATLLDDTHNKYPDVFILPTEACAGSNPWDLNKVELGSWERGEKYALDIIQDLLHWSVGWIDWNLALNMQGGPNWVENFVDAPIIVNNNTQEFYKQPMFYVLAHFSKFLPPDSVRIGIDSESNHTIPRNLNIAGFKTSDNSSKIVIILNRGHYNVPLILKDADMGFLNITSTARSIQSYVWSTRKNV